QRIEIRNLGERLQKGPSLAAGKDRRRVVGYANLYHLALETDDVAVRVVKSDRGRRIVGVAQKLMGIERDGAHGEHARTATETGGDESLASEYLIRRDDRIPREPKLPCQCPGRWQSRAGRQIARPDAAAKVLGETGVERWTAQSGTFFRVKWLFY